MNQTQVRARAIGELKEALAENRASIFVGAGASVDSGLPTWAGLLGEMINEVESQPGCDTSFISDARMLLTDKAKWTLLAQILKREMGFHFGDFIGRRFADKTTKPNDVHKAIVETPWKTIVTTNYDRLLEKSFIEIGGDDADIPTLTYSSASKIASSYCRNNRFILKAHGDAKVDPERVIMTEADYRHLVHRELGYQSILQTIFTTNSFLFVGSSVSDPDLHLLLGFLHSAFHGNTPVNYALLPENERLSAEDKLLFSDFKIHTVTIDPKNRANDIKSFLQALS